MKLAHDHECDSFKVLVFVLITALVTGKPIAAKPSKIVAGHDADRTNEFLQALAESVNKKVRFVLLINLGNFVFKIRIHYSDNSIIDTSIYLAY